jgi:hypothetical protein
MSWLRPVLSSVVLLALAWLAPTSAHAQFGGGCFGPLLPVRSVLVSRRVTENKQ